MNPNDIFVYVFVLLLAKINVSRWVLFHRRYGIFEVFQELETTERK